jgi:hypothetical protein
MPRPKKSSVQKQSQIVKLSLTPAMYESLSEKAKAAELPLATYCTNVLAKARSPKSIPSVNRELYNRFISDLGLPLSRMTQILHVLGKAQQNHATIPSRLLALLESEIQEIRHLRLQLVTEENEKDSNVG